MRLSWQVAANGHFLSDRKSTERKGTPLTHKGGNEINLATPTIVVSAANSASASSRSKRKEVLLVRYTVFPTSKTKDSGKTFSREFSLNFKPLTIQKIHLQKHYEIISIRPSCNLRKKFSASPKRPPTVLGLTKITRKSTTYSMAMNIEEICTTGTPGKAILFAQKGNLPPSKQYFAKKALSSPESRIWSLTSYPGSPAQH